MSIKPRFFFASFSSFLCSLFFACLFVLIASWRSCVLYILIYKVMLFLISLCFHFLVLLRVPCTQVCTALLIHEEKKKLPTNVFQILYGFVRFWQRKGCRRDFLHCVVHCRPFLQVVCFSPVVRTGSSLWQHEGKRSTRHRVADSQKVASKQQAAALGTCVFFVPQH